MLVSATQTADAGTASGSSSSSASASGALSSASAASPSWPSSFLALALNKAYSMTPSLATRLPRIETSSTTNLGLVAESHRRAPSSFRMASARSDTVLQPSTSLIHLSLSLFIFHTPLLYFTPGMGFLPALRTAWRTRNLGGPSRLLPDGAAALYDFFSSHSP